MYYALNQWKRVYRFIFNFFSSGHSRTILAKKNIALTFFFRGASVLTSLLLVPITINYVNPTQYGIWLTLSSIIAWFGFFDIGMGNGLRNKLSEAIANGDDHLAKKYVSTAYSVIALISAVLFSGFLFVNQYLNWSQILNTSQSLSKELSLVAVIVFAIFAVQFVLQLIHIICMANQNSTLTALTGFLGNVLGLLIVFVLTKTTDGSILYLCLSIGISPLVILIIFSLILYSSSYKKYAPSFKFASYKSTLDILNLGFKFFIIQIGLVFFYNANNIIITQVVGPEAVTPYNISFKYFGVITMISGIVMTPFWSAFTEAEVTGDHDWIRKTVRRLEIFCIPIFVLAVIMVLISSKAYYLWVGASVTVPFSLSVVLAVFVVLNTYRTIFCYYLNGVGKITIQLYLVLISGLINIPLGIYLGKLMGSTGVVLATTILCGFCGIIEVAQYKRLINKRASGIWTR